MLVPYPTDAGFRIAYAQTLRTPGRQSVWICAPTDDDRGSCQMAFVEHLAEQIRVRDPHAVALHLYWPLPTDNRSGHTHAIRVTFDDATTNPTHHAGPPPGVSVVGVTDAATNNVAVDELADYTVTNNTTRFSQPNWLNYTSTPARTLECATGTHIPVLHMTQDDIARCLETLHPEWAPLRAASLVFRCGATTPAPTELACPEAPWQSNQPGTAALQDH